MSISAHLDGLRSAVPGCSLVAFGDLDARLVLRASSDRPRPQEQLDELCMQAASLLSNTAGETVMQRVFGETGEIPIEAVVLTPDDVRVYVRSAAEQSDVLCCLCDSAMDAEGAIAAARRVLNKISDGQ
ncbi:hypothetical protein LCL97_03085 [Seohaeicola saemankumensis]|nr:hypothetical protein [Seohaeicola saemankumensis]MCA0869800.1 hypothetical protein [Seohaeicola saemankumensis]